ncbi:unnamed protein product [Pleuronectes platessa]|uniref:Uncharacterized protein n=1 Tax=Pleuronectes platessa TaxID=8262 RepID=A0A9N7U4U1_PLEPL|nr:unnamed protein product [Pleuronectes platessa]
MLSRPPSITKLSSSTVQDCQLVRVASESKLTVGHVRASPRQSEETAELPWEFTWSRRPTRHESLKRRTQTLKQKSRRKIKDVGSVKRKDTVSCFLGAEQHDAQPPDLAQLYPVKETMTSG